MSFALRLQRLPFALTVAVLAWANTACSDDDLGPKSCGPPGPSFDVSVQAPEPELPADLAVTALYGAGEETYRLSSPMHRSEVLFCSQQPRRAGDGTSGAPGLPTNPGGAGDPGDPPGDPVLRCELWTDSSVTVRVVSARYAPLERELEPMVDRCGVVTTDVELTLEWPSD